MPRDEKKKTELHAVAAAAAMLMLAPTKKTGKKRTTKFSETLTGARAPLGAAGPGHGMLPLAAHDGCTPTGRAWSAS